MSQNWRSGDERKVFAFVNFAHPNQMKDQARRSIVQSHVGRYYRNRSKPAQRRQKFNGLNASGQVAEAMHRSDSSEGIELILDDQDEGHENITYCSPHEVQRDEQFTLTDVSSVKHFQNKKELMESLVRKIQLHTQAAQGYREHSTEDQERSHARTEVLYRIANADLVGDLDQSRSDPFARYPVDRFASHVPALVDYAVQSFWSCLSPDRCYGVTNPVNNLYLTHMRSSPLACYTYTLVISTSIDYLRSNQGSTSIYYALRAEHLCAATKLVREALQRMPEEPGPESVGDELIGSILALASCYQIKVASRKSQPVSRFCSPLATFQSIDMWGALPFLQPHRLAVVQLVNMRGGLLKLSSSYLAGVVQLNDLVDASRKSCKPLLEWENILEPLPALKWPPQNSRDSPCVEGQASSFVSLFATNPPPYSLQDAIAATTHTTELLNKYNKDGQPDSSILTLVESRNRAQHLALSLPSVLNRLMVPKRYDYVDQEAWCDTSVLPKAYFSECLYEIVRLSLLAYNNLVVYPMPPVSGVQVRLTKSLRVALEYLLAMNGSESLYRSHWLVWSIMLGGISGERDEDRDWYRDLFCLLLEINPGLHEWQSLVDLLSSFLWSGSVLDSEGFEFWSDCTSGIDC